MNKTDTLKLRMSPLEKETFQKAADLAGIPVSAWVRDRLRRAARRELQDASLTVPFLQDIQIG